MLKKENKRKNSFVACSCLQVTCKFENEMS